MGKRDRAGLVKSLHLESIDLCQTISLSSGKPIFLPVWTMIQRIGLYTLYKISFTSSYNHGLSCYLLAEIAALL